MCQRGIEGVARLANSGLYERERVYVSWRVCLAGVKIEPLGNSGAFRPRKSRDTTGLPNAKPTTSPPATARGALLSRSRREYTRLPFRCWLITAFAPIANGCHLPVRLGTGRAGSLHYSRAMAQTATAL